MSRSPYAARVLTQQVRDHHGRSATSKVGLNTASPVGDPDGFGVIRSFKFDKVASKWLSKVLPHLDDERITGFEEKSGQVTVHFSPGIDADDRTPFNLDDAALVAEDGEVPEEDPGDDDSDADTDSE